MQVLDQFKLDGQVAVVTGGGKGIGRGIVLSLAQAGADVAVAARNEAEIAGVAAEVEALGRRAIAVPTDVTEADQLSRLAERCVAKLGDAPLDDTNVQRYSELVKEMSRTVQFIYITHNKIAMEMGEQLMGVTMHEPGSP